MNEPNCRHCRHKPLCSVRTNVSNALSSLKPFPFRDVKGHTDIRQRLYAIMASECVHFLPDEAAEKDLPPPRGTAKTAIGLSTAAWDLHEVATRERNLNGYYAAEIEKVCTLCDCDGNELNLVVHELEEAGYCQGCGTQGDILILRVIEHDRVAAKANRFAIPAKDAEQWE